MSTANISLWIWFSPQMRPVVQQLGIAAEVPGRRSPRAMKNQRGERASVKHRGHYGRLRPALIGVDVAETVSQKPSREAYMICIRPSSLRCVGQVALTACLRGLVARGRDALLLGALSAAGCTFDVTPRMLTRDGGGAATKWLPPSAAGDGGDVDPQAGATTARGSADAEKSGDNMPSDEAGIRGQDGDAGRKFVDAAQQRDADPSTTNVPASPSSMGTIGLQDATVPAVMNPQMSSPCMPGIYEGEFDGPVTFAVGSINSVAGTMRAELVLEPSGDTLRIRDGVITGMDITGLGMSAGWTGALNCATRQLEGQLEAGSWENGSRFNGMLEGMYSVNPSSLSGTWQVQSLEIPLAGGNGRWRMILRGSPAP